MTRFTRRRMFGIAGTGVALAGAGAVGAGIDRARDPRPAAAPLDIVDFHGAHQAGIVTPAQEHLHFAALDVTTEDRAKLVSLLRTWTDAARCHPPRSPTCPPSRRTS
jgi:deferrochelatase/peroxidase EfeB